MIYQDLCEATFKTPILSVNATITEKFWEDKKINKIVSNMLIYKGKFDDGVEYPEGAIVMMDDKLFVKSKDSFLEIGSGSITISAPVFNTSSLETDDGSYV